MKDAQRRGLNYMLRVEYVRDKIEKGKQDVMYSASLDDKYSEARGYTSGYVQKISIPDQIRMWPYLLALRVE